jgi:hypothetical protein
VAQRLVCKEEGLRSAPCTGAREAYKSGGQGFRYSSIGAEEPGVEHLECEASIQRGQNSGLRAPALHPPQWMCDYSDGLHAISCLGEAAVSLLSILLHDGASPPFNGQRKN